MMAAPALAALPAAAAPQPGTAQRDEFAKIDTETATERAGDPVPRFFTKAEYAALERLAAAILPSADGKPGALEAGVPAFLDFLISRSPAPRQKLYREGLAKLSAGATLDSLKGPWTYKPPADAFRRFLREAKADIIRATFNSKEWIESRPGGRGGAGTYYLAVD